MYKTCMLTPQSLGYLKTIIIQYPMWILDKKKEGKRTIEKPCDKCYHFMQGKAYVLFSLYVFSDAVRSMMIWNSLCPPWRYSSLVFFLFQLLGAGVLSMGTKYNCTLLVDQTRSLYTLCKNSPGSGGASL